MELLYKERLLHRPVPVRPDISRYFDDFQVQSAVPAKKYPLWVWEFTVGRLVSIGQTIFTTAWRIYVVSAIDDLL